MMRSQGFFPEKKVLIRGFLWVPQRVCLGCSLLPVDSMLQSGTLFTFWTQLTSPSLCPSVLPSPSFHFSLSLSLYFSSCLTFCLSLLFGFSLQPSLNKDFNLQRSTKTSPNSTRDDITAREWLHAWCFTHYGATHKQTERERGFVQLCIWGFYTEFHSFSIPLFTKNSYLKPNQFKPGTYLNLNSYLTLNLRSSFPVSPGHHNQPSQPGSRTQKLHFATLISHKDQWSWQGQCVGQKRFHWWQNYTYSVGSLCSWQTSKAKCSDRICAITPVNKTD